MNESNKRLHKYRNNNENLFIGAAGLAVTALAYFLLTRYSAQIQALANEALELIQENEAPSAKDINVA